jgi:ribosome-associated translation inhibitor RaiA
MQTPLQVTFHELPSSPSVEDDIRHQVDDLERHFDRIIGCRVTVETPHRHQHQGRLYRIRLELDLPDAHIVSTSHDVNAAHEDVHVAVHDAFRAAKRQLQDRVSIRRDHR